MYFKDKNDTNIDDEFDNGNSIISIIFDLLKKYKLVFIGLLVLAIIVVFILLFTSNKKVIVTNYLILNGDENITIYEDTDYIELGFDAYNSNDEDLTNEVDISSNLDTSNVGEYEITYTLGDITKIRKIIVVEKPKEYTYIYLKTVNNDVNVYLNVGEIYDEPGYQVFSSTGKNLTNEVKITGFVDVSKRGNYKLIYSIVDSNNVTVSVTRTVIVMDTEINLSLSTKEYTNKEITINVEVIDDYFDYMIIPNNEKITKKTYSYKVSENGKYTFAVYNKRGIIKSSSIEVNNIDKVVPTGSCTVDHDKNGSFITIDVKDNSGIKQYIYNNKSYNSNKITLSEYIDSASVTAYDKAGNSKTFNCNVLELKDELFVDTSHYSDLKGLNYVKIAKVDVKDVGCNAVNGGGTPISYYWVHEAIADDFHGILTNVCTYINASSWIDNLQSAGTYVNKGESYHAKGLAIDLNNQWVYTLNGKEYRPYATMGSWAWNQYNKFICEVCDGKEDCKYNVNYILFKRYFEGNGWCWGGNWGIEHFDPMHFEIRENNKCIIARKQQIDCSS